MTLRKPILLVAPLFLLACGEAGQEPVVSNSEDQGNNTLASRVSAITGKPVAEVEAGVEAGQAWTADASEAMAPAEKGLRRYTVYSEQYKVPSAYIQLPAHWKVQGLETGYWSATAPGLRVQNHKAGMFKDVTGPMRQMSLAMGESLRAPMGMEQVFTQEFAPKMRSEGFELVDRKPMPELARKSAEDLAKLYNPSNISPVLQSMVSVWRKGDQRRALFLNTIAINDDGFVVWGYSFTTMDAPASSFDTEKNSLIQAALTAQPAPEGIAAQHRDAKMKEQQSRIQAQQQQFQNQQSWAAHNQRMQTNQAAFNAQQAAHIDRVNSVNNSIIGGYNSTMNSMDRMQNATINGIRGEQDAYNPYTGEAGKIQSGYDNYWMNSDGQYFGTNDGTRNPNIHSDWTDQWRQVPTEP